MGRSRYKIFEPAAPHFVTFTVLEWQPLFTRPATAEILLDALRFRQETRGLKIYAYVILENHMHAVLQADDLSKEIHSFKTYTVGLLIKRLKELGAQRMLKLLEYFKKAHKRDHIHQVWEEGCHPQLMQNEPMLLQKIEYIHHNPVKRGYVDYPEHWRYSSARDYIGQPGLLPVYMDWWLGEAVERGAGAP